MPRVQRDGGCRSVFDRLMTSKKTLLSVDRGVAVTKVLVRDGGGDDNG